MVHIYYTVFESTIPENHWNALVQQMPTSIQQRLLRYRKQENQYQLLLGRLLLKKILFDLGFMDFRLSDLQYTEHQKPVWKKPIEFSIAHSGKVVICAVSTHGVIGIDVERIQNLAIEDFHHVFNSKDYQELELSTDTMKTFFKLWTIKEAVSKADGRGLGMDVQHIYINEQIAQHQQDKWYYRQLLLAEGFQCHYVSKQAKMDSTVLKEVRMEEY